MITTLAVIDVAVTETVDCFSVASHNKGDDGKYIGEKNLMVHQQLQGKASHPHKRYARFAKNLFVPQKGQFVSKQCQQRKPLTCTTFV